MQARAHITLNCFSVGELKSVVLSRHSSAATAVNLSEVLTAYKVTTWLLAQKKVALRQGKGWMLSSQTRAWAGRQSGIIWRGMLPMAQPRLGQVTLTTSSATTGMVVAWKESNGEGCCLLAYKRGLKAQSIE